MLNKNENATHDLSVMKPSPECMKNSCSTQLLINVKMPTILPINVKMPTIVGIITFMNGKNSILGLSEPEKSLIS